MRNGLPIAGLAVSGLVFLARRRRQRRKRDDDGCTVDDSAASFTTSAYGDAGSAPRVHGSGSSPHRRRTTSKRIPPWEQILIIAGLIIALAMGVQKQSYDVVALMAVLLVVCIISLWRQRNTQAQAAGLLDDQSTAGQDIIVRQPVAVYAPDMRLAGTWIKDGRASDPMTTACDMMSLNGVIRMAVALVKGVELQLGPVAVPRTGEGQSNGDALSTNTSPPTMEFHIAVFSVISWFKVREQYQLGPAPPPSFHNRRDLRRGKHTGTAAVLPDGGVRLELRWGEPIPGTGYDEFRLESDNELHVTSHLCVGSRKHTYTIVYQRKK